jgi:hypothetical protein
LCFFVLLFFCFVAQYESRPFLLEGGFLIIPKARSESNKKIGRYFRSLF